jgi:pilus assembly protein FimV
MVSSEVQRTLVKSPPELWAEISDPESLARHLGEFGEIRITRVHAEQRVEWESDDARGTVAIKPSGWGTKVKLTVTRELPQPSEAASEDGATSEPGEAAMPDVEPDLAGGPEPALQAEAEHPLDALLEVEPPARDAQSAEQPPPLLDAEPEDESEHELELEDESEHELELEDESEPELEHELESEPEPRRGFFARLFSRRRRARSALQETTDDAEPMTDDEAPAEPSPARGGEAIADAADETEPTLAAQAVAAPPAKPSAALAGSPDVAAADEALATTAALDGADEHELGAAEDEPAEDAAEERSPDIAAEVRAAEEVAAEQVTAVLTGVLDRLGSAHHRPFSRS